MINQLFKRRPTESELNLILSCYQLKGIDDYTRISFATINFFNTIERLYELSGLLIELYLPCKLRYITNLNNKKTITILRQICKLFDRKVNYNFIISNKVKFIEFNICDPNLKMIEIQKNKIVSFN